MLRLKKKKADSCLILPWHKHLFFMFYVSQVIGWEWSQKIRRAEQSREDRKASEEMLALKGKKKELNWGQEKDRAGSKGEIIALVMVVPSEQELKTSLVSKVATCRNLEEADIMPVLHELSLRRGGQNMQTQWRLLPDPAAVADEHREQLLYVQLPRLLGSRGCLQDPFSLVLGVSPTALWRASFLPPNE